MKLFKPAIRTMQRTAAPTVYRPPEVERAGTPIYNTERWKQLSATMRKNGHCVVCGATTRQRRLFVDHRIEIRDGGDPWHPANLQILCALHHRHKTIAASAARADKGETPGPGGRVRS